MIWDERREVGDEAPLGENRREGEEKTNGDRDGQREPERAAINLDVSGGWKRRGTEGDQDSNAPLRGDRAQRSADSCDETSFGKPLTNQACWDAPKFTASFPSRRITERTQRRLATLTQAIRRTAATAQISTNTELRNEPNSSSCNDATVR